MKVMVVDDVLFIRTVMRASLEQSGIECIEAESGQKALELFKQHEFDVILMDVMMPEMDGVETTRQIKALCGDRHVPVIFMTGLAESDALQRCLECGGDDFVNKDIDPIALQARIRAHARTHEMNQQVRQKSEEISQLYEDLSEEYHMAQHVMESVTADNDLQIPNLITHLRSMSIFNGDLFLSTKKASGGFCFFLGDFTGHGLPASIGAMPASQVFFESNQQQSALSEIARRINAVLTRCLPDYMFCAAIIGELDAQGEYLKLWHGGLPDILFVREGEGVVKEVESRHMPLGILDNTEFDDSVRTYRLTPSESVILQTDGLIESVGTNGDMYGFERFKENISSYSSGQISPDRFLPQILNDWEGFCGDNQEQDDMSLIVLRPGSVEPPNLTSVMPDLLSWETKFVLGVQELRMAFDPVAFMLNQIRLPRRYFGHLSYLTTILKELFNNALEHGLLELESSMKSGDDGMLEYYQQREHRLQALSHGEIIILLGLDATKTPHQMKVHVRHTGKGFDFQSYQGKHFDANSEQLFGRGIALVQGLCHALVYSNEGRSVDAVYELS